MKKLSLVILLTVAWAGAAWGQQADARAGGSANSNTSARKQPIDLQSQTQLAAQLENSLDARHAKTGDRVVLKTVQAVKQDGHVVVPKGAQVIGHVTEVQQQTKSNAESRIGVVIDRLRSGSTETPITASILSITQARSRGQASNDSFESDAMAQSSASSRSTTSTSGQRGGGLLGGVGNTVGGVVGTTTSTAGNVAGSTTSAVGNTVGATTNTTANTTSGLGGALRGLQITQSTDASAQGGSTLSLTGGNLRLESGTTFTLAVSSSTSAGNNP